jgi:ATP-dependent protease ClpP protease subunit
MSNGLSTDRNLTFFGSIREPRTTNFRSALCGMVNEGAKNITVLFASDGGSTDDGIALFTYLRALPVELTMHAMGVVSSIAVPVFLAAGKDRRFASVHSRFYFHDYNWTFGAQVVARPAIAEAALLLSNALDWTKDILRAETKLSDDKLKAMKLFDEPHVMFPAEAAKMGLVSAVAEPTIAAGSQPRIVT